MSEGTTSTTKMWRGIPLSHVRSGFFIDKLSMVSTLAKWIVNGDETRFSTAEDGAVTLDGSYLNWMFIAPVGMFSSADFENRTVSDLFATIASRARSSYVKSWEEFIGYIDEQVSVVNNLMSGAASASVQGVGASTRYALSSIPQFSRMGSFSSFLSWILSMIPQALQEQSASVLRLDGSGGQYTYCVILNIELDGGDTVAMTFSFVL